MTGSPTYSRYVWSSAPTRTSTASPAVRAGLVSHAMRLLIMARSAEFRGALPETDACRRA
jgi:hypothetical protein